MLTLRPFGLDITVVLICSAALSILVELTILRRIGRRVSLSDAGQSVIHGLTWAGLRLYASKLLWFGAWLHVFDNYALFAWNMAHPLSWLVYWLVGDLLYYWTHRAEHHIRALWCSHLVHHSSEHFNLTTAVRQPWTEGLYKPAIAMWAPLLGFHPSIYVVFGAASLAIGQWQHLEWFPKLPVVDRIFMSPSNHRVHHGRNPEYIDRNFGGSLVLWDHLFGTYAPETVQPAYGVLHLPEHRSKAARLLGGYPELVGDMARAASPGGAIRLALGRPDSAAIAWGSEL